MNVSEYLPMYLCQDFIASLFQAKGFFKIKQKWVTSGKLIAFKASSSLASLTYKRGQRVKEIKKGAKQGEKSGRKK